MAKLNRQYLFIKRVIFEMKLTLKIRFNPISLITQFLPKINNGVTQCCSFLNNGFVRFQFLEGIDRIDKFNVAGINPFLRAKPQVKIQMVGGIFDLNISDGIEIYAGVDNMGFVHILSRNSHNASGC